MQKVIELIPCLRRRLDDGFGLLGVAGEGNGHRLDLVNRGVRRIKLPRQIVEGDITTRRRQRRKLLSRSHRVASNLSALRQVDNAEPKGRTKRRKTKAGFMRLSSSFQSA